MDYEKLYKEALENAREIIKNKDASSVWKNWLYNNFPELAESEDDRIRKGIIRNLMYLMDRAEGFVKDELNERIVWLEKQESVEEIVERCKNSWYNEGKIAGMAEGLTDDEKYQQGWHDALEKQGGQKWSEEDEMMCTIAINACEYANDEFESFNDNYEKAIMWLKSLKKQMEE